MQFLSNPLWQFAVNAAIGLFTIIVTIIIYRKQQNRRSVTYEIISDTPILSLKEEIKGRVQVLFDTKPVGEVRLVTLKLKNSGDMPVLPNEYIEPIKVDFGESADILDVDVLETVPDDIKNTIKALLKVEGSKIVFEPFLLNSGDAVIIKALIAQPRLTKEIKVSTRIIGINQLQNSTNLPHSTAPFVRLATYCSYLIFIISVIYFLLIRYTHGFSEKAYFILIVGISSIFYVIAYTLLLSIYTMIERKSSFGHSFKYIIGKLIDLIKYMLDETTYTNRL